MSISRRDIFKGALASTAGAFFGSISDRAFAQIESPMPVGYVAHGSPFLLADEIRGPELRRWGAALRDREGRTPLGIVVMTPHYRAMDVEMGHVGKGFGMYNLPDWILAKTPKAAYASPDNTELAQRVTEAISVRHRIRPSTNRVGFDHTTWIPLFHMFPNADIPVVEIALPFWADATEDLVDLGRTLAPLRSQRILFLASGTLTHNLAATDLSGKTAVPAWSSNFDAWVKKSLEARDVDALVNWRKAAPNSDVAHPDDGGHFRVLLVALGVAMGTRQRFTSVTFPVEGFELGNLSKRCVELT
jgi:4,5-DOPA dioxygenase extradiol